MKLFLSTDFEGVSGIVAWEQIIEGNSEYEQGRRLLTGEVNAVISGALEEGAKEFVVNDSHHYMRNLHPQDLLGNAMLITGKHKPMYMMEGDYCARCRKSCRKAISWTLCSCQYSSYCCLWDVAERSFTCCS